jgi:hypothetical protein
MPTSYARALELGLKYCIGTSRARRQSRPANFATRVTIADVGADMLVIIDGGAGQTIKLVGIADASTVTQAGCLL